MEGNDGWLIIDAGTGLSSLNKRLRITPRPPKLAFIFTHFHMDHLIGLPSFEPLYRSQSHITMLADPRRAHGWRDSLRTFIGTPFWPVGLYEANAAMELQDLPVERKSWEWCGINVRWHSVPHPQSCLAFRLESSTQSVVVMTDAEYETNTLDESVVDFCRDADHLCMDAQFTPDEYPAYRGWGHSTWLTATTLAERANVRNLVLIHHAPDRPDFEVRRIQDQARERFRNTTAAPEGMVLRPD